MIQHAGRFAPSPTGSLHQGSLLASTASYLDARARGLQWWLRIDDLDTPRVAPGAEDAIRKTLDAHALHWDGPVIHQSGHIARYEAALATLSAQGLLFYCTCTRAMLADETIYPGSCRHRTAPVAGAAIRVLVEDRPVRFHDLVRGDQEEVLARTCGDFVVRRRDGQIAYQLATAVDDGSEAISHVVRGGDLLDNTARQIYLMERLGLTVPSYAHLPVLVDASGQKLSKQTHAPAVVDDRASANLLVVFRYLGLDPPAEARHWSPAVLLDWAIPRFDLKRVQAASVTARD
ncbi:MAG: tRNA glutamyl-Q(34) synthetase GluQRS [Pseudomonadales bacterium]